MTRAGLSEDEFAERRAVRPLLAAHFIMWRTLEGPSLGEWFCECGLKFGLSDSAIDHQADIVAARTADLAAQVARVEAERDRWQDKWKRRGVTIERIKAERDQFRRESAEHLALLGGETAIALARAALSPAQPDTEGAS